MRKFSVLGLEGDDECIGVASKAIQESDLNDMALATNRQVGLVMLADLPDDLEDQLQNFFDLPEQSVIHWNRFGALAFSSLRAGWNWRCDYEGKHDRRLDLKDVLAKVGPLVPPEPPKLQMDGTNLSVEVGRLLSIVAMQTSPTITTIQKNANIMTHALLAMKDGWNVAKASLRK